MYSNSHLNPVAMPKIAQPNTGSKFCFKRQFDQISYREHREGFQLDNEAQFASLWQSWLAWRTPIGKDDHVQENR
jgi:hypothetical protein